MFSVYSRLIPTPTARNTSPPTRALMSVLQRMPVYRTPYWLSRLRRRKYNRKHGLPHNFGGMWKSNVRLRSEATEDIELTSEGWLPRTIMPEQLFIAKELAIRYEAAAAEMKMHYTHLCDIPTPEEADERIRRILSCLETMEQLSGIEQKAREAFGSDIENMCLSKD